MARMPPARSPPGALTGRNPPGPSVGRWALPTEPHGRARSPAHSNRSGSSLQSEGLITGSRLPLDRLHCGAGRARGIQENTPPNVGVLSPDPESGEEPPSGPPGASQPPRCARSSCPPGNHRRRARRWRVARALAPGPAAEQQPIATAPPPRRRTRRRRHAPPLTSRRPRSGPWVVPCHVTADGAPEPASPRSVSPRPRPDAHVTPDARRAPPCRGASPRARRCLHKMPARRRRPASPPQDGVHAGERHGPVAAQQAGRHGRTVGAAQHRVAAHGRRHRQHPPLLPRPLVGREAQAAARDAAPPAPRGGRGEAARAGPLGLSGSLPGADQRGPADAAAGERGPRAREGASGGRPGDCVPRSGAAHVGARARPCLRHARWGLGLVSP